MQGKPDLSTRYYWIFIACLLAAMAAAQFVAAIGESQTVDEGVDLTAGYLALTEGDFGFVPEHPPLAPAVAALPLLFLKPALPPRPNGNPTGGGVFAYAQDFVYHNRVSADAILLAGRSMIVGLTLLLGFFVAFWTRRYFGAAAGLLATALFAFDPNLIAHGHYTTTDMAAALWFFAAAMTWGQYLESGSAKRAALAGAALGLALVSKFSCLILIPVFAAMWLMRPRRPRTLAVTAATMCLVVWACYGFYTKPLLAVEANPHPFQSDSSTLSRWTAGMPAVRQAIAFAAAKVPVPASVFGIGLYSVMEHDRLGHAAYFLGKNSIRGWRMYFPVAFAVKTPLGTLLFGLLALALGVAAWRRTGWRVRIPPPHWLALSLPPLVYFACAVMSHIDLGIRYLLPVYPFLFVAAAAAVSKAGRRALAPSVALVLVTVVESISAAPHYTAFFNSAAGGAASGTRYLADSNLDWGQDLKKLRAYMDLHGASSVCGAYFGSADPAYYGVTFREWRGGDCMVAVSASTLFDGTGRFARLRGVKPDAKVGYSIFVWNRPP